MVAAWQGAAWRVSDLLSAGVSPDARDAKGCTALMAAAAQGHLESVRLLLDASANPMLFVRDGVTALELAASAGHVDCIQILLDRGVDVNGTYLVGRHALVKAAGLGRSEAVKLLLHRGADPNRRMFPLLSPTPLMVAALYGHTDIVRTLLEGGARIGAISFTLKGFRSAAWLARHGGHEETAALLDAWDTAGHRAA